MSRHYQATAAAIRTAYGQRLRPADYRALANMHSVPEIVAYLKETPAYGEILGGLEPGLIHRGYLELLLKRNLFSQCLHFCKLERLQHTPFFRFFIYDYEIQELMKKLQLLPEGQEAYIAAMDAWLSPYLTISLDDLARAEDFAGVIRAVAKTPYAAVLKKLQNTGANYTDCEIALRACYLERLRQEAKQTLKGSDLDALNQLIGEQIDLINIINAYRLKQVFHADGAAVRRMILPVQGTLPQRHCDALYDAPDTAAFLEALQNTRYGRMLPARYDPADMELNLQRLRYRNARSALHFSGHAAVSLYAQHFLCQTEVRNLITLVEGIRYGKSPDVLQNFLVTE